MPHVGFTVAFSFYISVLGFFKKYLRLPFPRKHIFDGEHYWELGKKGYSVSNFKKVLLKFFLIEKEFTDPLDTYHHFFILKKK